MIYLWLNSRGVAVSDPMPKRGARFVSLLAIVSLIGWPPFIASAFGHGSASEVRILGERVGAYDVTVRTTPKPPRIGHLHVQVQLIEPEALTYVKRAKVTAVGTMRGKERLETAAVSSQYRHPWHEIDIDFTKSGSWKVRLMIDGPLGREELWFPLDVVSRE